MQVTSIDWSLVSIGIITKVGLPEVLSKTCVLNLYSMFPKSIYTEKNDKKKNYGKWLQAIYFSYYKKIKNKKNESTKFVYLNVAKINWLQPLTLKKIVNSMNHFFLCSMKNIQYVISKKYPT